MATVATATATALLAWVATETLIQLVQTAPLWAANIIIDGDWGTEMVSEGLLGSQLTALCNQSQNQPFLAALRVGRAAHASLWLLLRCA